MRRREFITLSAMAGGALLLPTFSPRAYGAFLRTRSLRKFIQPLRLFGPDIPAMVPDRATYPGVDDYQIAMDQYTDVLHPDLGGATTLWGYGAPGGPFKHLGGAIIATQGTPVRVRWTNNLPNVHPLPVDMSVIEPYGIPSGVEANRATPHLHGGHVPWPSDGGPFHWFSSTRDGTAQVTGPSVSAWLPDPAAGNALTDDYWYPNIQSARLMWYHDHAVGITRLNAYAGLASGYILTDNAERTLMNQLRIPAERQIPLVVQDKVFKRDGSLWYPDFYDTAFFDLEENAEPLPQPSLVPEFWGDTMLVNGTVYPFLGVEPRRYRIRIINACNTRFLSLRLVAAAGRTWPANTEPSLTNPGPAMLLVGTEGGFLDGTAAPQGVSYPNTAAMPLVLAPAERADIIIDFSKVKTTTTDPLCFILHNDAPVPYPGGLPNADFHPENKKLAMPPQAGYGPNTRTLLQFKVLPLGSITGDTNPDSAPERAWTLPPSPVPAATVAGSRDLALYETVDRYGRLAQNLGTLSGPLEMMDPATEIVQAGTVETWRIFNLTADTHPIHFHYFNVRVVSRQRFRLARGTPAFRGTPAPAAPGEQGWKETVRVNPGECTTVLADIPSLNGLAPSGVSIPTSPRTGGHEYVWHCHILEHEEHDMMRPLVVL